MIIFTYVNKHRFQTNLIHMIQGPESNNIFDFNGMIGINLDIFISHFAELKPVQMVFKKTDDEPSMLRRLIKLNGTNQFLVGTDISTAANIGIISPDPNVLFMIVSGIIKNVHSCTDTPNKIETNVHQTNTKKYGKYSKNTKCSFCSSLGSYHNNGKPVCSQCIVINEGLEKNKQNNKET